MKVYYSQGGEMKEIKIPLLMAYSININIQVIIVGEWIKRLYKKRAWTIKGVENSSHLGSSDRWKYIEWKDIKSMYEICPLRLKD